MWAYIDVYDLADALRARRAVRPRHPRGLLHRLARTTTPTGRSPTSSATTTATRSSCASPSPAPTRPGLSIAKAERLLGYAPSRSWRDYLTEDGELLDAARERFEREDTGVQRGRAVG